MKSEALISVVIVLRYSLDKVKTHLQQLYTVLDSHFSDYEIVLIAQDFNLSDAQVEDNILKEIPCVRIIQLATTVDDDVALAAGIENAIGDFVVLWNPESDPVEIIPASVQQCRNGCDVIIGVVERSKNYCYHLLRKVMRKVLNAIDYDLPENSTEYRCLSRRAVNAVTRTGRFHHQFYLRIQKTGYPMGTLSYQPTGNIDNKTIYQSLRKLVRLMVFNSSRPLRWMSVLGVVGSMAAFLFATYSIVVHAINGNVVEGWTTIVLFMSLLFTLLFIIMTFFGEYLGRLLDENSKQSEYYVVYERNSEVMINADRKNVLHSSLNSEMNFVQTGRDR